MLLLAILVACVAALNLAGWFTQRPLWISSFPAIATMKPNTAVCLLLLTGSLLARRSRPGFAVLSHLLAGSVVAIALGTLLEYWTGHAFGFDQWLIPVPPEFAGGPLGRMSAGTAYDALLTGAALLLLERAPVAAAALCSAAAFLSSSALVGFLFDAGPLLGVPLLRSMALRTALSFAFLQTAFFLLRPDHEPTRSVLHSVRHHRAGGWFLLGTCLVPLLLGWPIAVLYRHGRFEATFAFALLVVALTTVQTWLVLGNSRSLAEVEEKRARLEQARQALAAQNEAQHAQVLASEQEAAQSEALYRLITDSLPAMVSYVDRDLCYRRANQTYEFWFGIPAAEIEGKSLDEVLGISAAQVQPRIVAALGGVAQHFEAPVKTIQGERLLSISHMPDRAANGTVRGVVVHANDITHARQAETALRQTEKLAAVGKLASSIAHEINNPLEAVMNLLYLANMDEALPAEARGYLTTAEEELRRVSAIASQTLRFHKQSTLPTSIHAEELLLTVLAIYRNRMGGRIRLQQRHRPAAPLLCLEGEIRQVLNNLVGNALDAIQSESGTLWVRSQEGTHGKTGALRLVITVADSGTGMSATTLATIFDAFFTTKGMNGTGLGLWVSKEIIERHHGTLQVRSSQAGRHHGTVFRLVLPYGGFQPNENAAELA